MTHPLAGLGNVPPVVLVGVGGSLGAVARHLLGTRVESDVVDTVLVNALGSLALGAVLAASIGDAGVLLFGTGFCGAFTTFSTFAVETVRLAERGHTRRAVGNAAGTLALALLAVAAGGVVGTALVSGGP